MANDSSSPNLPVEYWDWVYTADGKQSCVVEAAPYKAARIIASGDCQWSRRPAGFHWDGGPVRSSVRNAINRRIIKNRGRVDD